MPWWVGLTGGLRVVSVRQHDYHRQVFPEMSGVPAPAPTLVVAAAAGAAAPRRPINVDLLSTAHI